MTYQPVAWTLDESQWNYAIETKKPGAPKSSIFVNWTIYDYVEDEKEANRLVTFYKIKYPEGEWRMRKVK